MRITQGFHDLAKLFSQGRDSEMSGVAASYGKKFDDFIKDYFLVHLKAVRKLNYKSSQTAEVLKAVNIYKRKGFIELAKAMKPDLFVRKQINKSKAKLISDLGLTQKSINYILNEYNSLPKYFGLGIIARESIFTAINSSNRKSDLHAITGHFANNNLTNSGIDFLISKNISLAAYVSGVYTAKFNTDIELEELQGRLHKIMEDVYRAHENPVKEDFNPSLTIDLGNICVNAFSGTVNVSSDEKLDSYPKENLLSSLKATTTSSPTSKSRRFTSSYLDFVGKQLNKEKPSTNG